MEGKGEPGEGRMKEGIASIALLPCGSISGHFIQLPHSVCYALHGAVMQFLVLVNFLLSLTVALVPVTEIACERECSRGEDYRLIKLTISDYVTQREKNVIVECRGHDAARFCNVEHAHGWDNDVIRTLEKVEKKDKISVSFECETLKSDKAAEDHIRQFMPKLVGLGAVGECSFF
ncbi:hypothetical protein EJ110_NYTH47635 [Nymphaea thermarum]|nr:hypothetical protein EJ110_NYTH47635 [Nymphaea thermarum]